LLLSLLSTLVVGRLVNEHLREVPAHDPPPRGGQAESV